MAYTFDTTNSNYTVTAGDLSIEKTSSGGTWDNERILPRINEDSGLKSIDILIDDEQTYIIVGIKRHDTSTSGYVGSGANDYGYNSFNGFKYNNSSGSSYGSTSDTGDTITVEYDSDSGTVKFYINDIDQGVAFTGITGDYYFAVSIYNLTGALSIVPPENVFIEDDYAFEIRSLTEGFYNFSASKALVFEKEYQYKAAPAIKFETEYPYNIFPSVKVEDDYVFDIAAYKAYEDAYSFAVKMGVTPFETEFKFEVPFRVNELYEEMFRYHLNGVVLSTAIQAGLSVIVDNVALEVISVSGGRNGYYNLFEISALDDHNIQSLLPVGAAAGLSWHSAKLEGDTVTPVVDKQYTLLYKEAGFGSSASEQGDTRLATLRLVSPTAQLDKLPDPIGGSAPVTTIWPAGTMSSTVLDDLCLPYLTYTLEYSDFPLLQDLDGGERYPIEIINELYPLAWIGPDEDGNLWIRRKLLHSPDDMLSDDFVFDLDLPESEYIIDINTDYPSLPLYNSVTVATVSESDSVIFPAPEIVEDEGDSSKATVYGYRYPWFQFDLITCNTECGNIVITAGKEEVVEITQNLDFDDGKATFSLPIHEFVSVDWDCNASLGTITASGDGSLQAAVSGWSFGAVTCKVRRSVFQLTAYNRDDDLKFRLRDED
jgi:hypothetical protein